MPSVFLLEPTEEGAIGEVILKWGGGGVVRFQMPKKQTGNPEPRREGVRRGQPCPHPQLDVHAGVRVFPPVPTVFSPHKDVSKPDCLLSDG